MPKAEILIAFLLATMVFAYMPGPAMLYAAAQTITRGRRAGWMAALGIHIGGYAHIIAAALGLAFLFHAVPVLYWGLKLLGAAYLIWLGLQLFVSKQPSIDSASEIDQPTARRAFRQSIIVEVLNPKTAIFYLAFLPQFTDMSASLPIWAQLLILGMIVNIVFSSADLMCVLVADKVMQKLQSSLSVSRYLQRIGGGILIALGINLAITRS